MSYRVDFPFIEEAKKLFDPAIVNKAQRLAITGIKGKAKTLISRTVRRRFNVANARIAKSLKMKNIDRGGLRSASLEYTGQRIGLINFAAKFKRVTTTGSKGRLAGKRLRRMGATAKVFKNQRRSLIPGAFIVRGTSGNIQVLQRIDKNNPKSKLRKLTGPAVPQMVSQPDVTRSVNDLLNKEFPQIFESKINFILERQR